LVSGLWLGLVDGFWPGLAGGVYLNFVDGFWI
jgi:hypothetical protein